jgi:hypothetical protein
MNVTEEKLGELSNALNTARATVFVTAEALDSGESDLELQSAIALKKAFELVNEVYDTVVAMRTKAYSEENPEDTP